MTNIDIFLTAVLLTFIFVRVFTYLLPSKTPTAYLRHKTLLYIHHIYAGIIILAITVPLIISSGLTSLLIVFSGIGLALCLDELAAWLLYSEYPAKKEFFITVVLFVVFSVFVYLA